jgi:leucyl aminopeptidase (aminopeptidase T)
MASPNRRARTRSEVMPLENRNLKKGTVLQARYRGKERTCDVVHTADRLRYRLDDGREFTSPSSAGKAAMNGVACNGWRFWSVEGTETPKREPKAKAERPAKAKRDAVAKKPARTKSDSYGCGVCPETFPTQKKAVAHAMTHAA